jgi:hypothetical protein
VQGFVDIVRRSPITESIIEKGGVAVSYAKETLYPKLVSSISEYNPNIVYPAVIILASICTSALFSWFFCRKHWRKLSLNRFSVIDGNFTIRGGRITIQPEVKNNWGTMQNLDVTVQDDHRVHL